MVVSEILNANLKYQKNQMLDSAYRTGVKPVIINKWRGEAYGYKK